MEWETFNRPQDKENKEKKEAGAAASLARAGVTIASLARAEMAKTRGSQRRRDFKFETLEREVETMMRKKESEKNKKEKEEREKIAQRERETGMIEKLIQFMDRDGVFNEYQENWDVGQMSCFINNIPQEKWNIIVAALGRSRFMVSWGWGDLLGVYLTELDNELSLKKYVRITPDEVERFSEIVKFLKEKGMGSNLKERAVRWRDFQLQQEQEKEEGEKKSNRSFHKVLTSTELEALERIADTGGKIHPINLGGQMGYSTNYARALCKSLGRADYVDFIASGWCVITLKGREELKKRGRLKEE